jgi:sugar phosphate isomerase/epimerase
MKADEKRISRRQFALTGLMAACGPAAISLLAQARKRGRRKARKAAGKIPIAVQLYSVRQECAKDLPATLAGVAKIGYKGVEFAGYYSRSGAELRKLLDDNGLKTAGSHIGIDNILADKLKETIDFNKEIGNRNLIVPSLGPKYTKTKELWLDTAKLFNEAAAKAKEEGLRVGYHNHSGEFKPLEDGAIPFDVFFGATDKDVIMQLDIGHALHGGCDPAAILNKYPGRAITVHVKEWSEAKSKAKEGYVVGEGDVKWDEVFQACETVGGTEWYIIEEETNAFQGLEGIDKSFQAMQKMGKA